MADDIGKLLLRFTVGGLMLFHGFAKIVNGIPRLGPLLATHGIPSYLAYCVYIGEFVAPLLLIVGFRTRLAALLVVINMLVAVYVAHMEDVFMLKPGSGAWAVELEALYLLGALVIFAIGAGKYAVGRQDTVWG